MAVWPRGRALARCEVRDRSVDRPTAIKPKAGSTTGGSGIERNLRSNLAADHIVCEGLADRALAGLIASRHRPSQEDRRSGHTGYRHGHCDCDLQRFQV
jgi:hypothetical protein